MADRAPQEWCREQPYRDQRDALRAWLADRGQDAVPLRLRTSALLAARRDRTRARSLEAAGLVAVFAAGGAGGWLAYGPDLRRMRDAARECPPSPGPPRS